MKSYEEALNDIYAKAYQQQQQINRRRKIVANIALVCVAVVVAVSAGIGLAANETPPAMRVAFDPTEAYCADVPLQNTYGMNLAQITTVYEESFAAWMNENLGVDNWGIMDSAAQANENWTKAFYVVSFEDANGNGIFDKEENVAKYHWYYQTESGAWADKASPDQDMLLYPDTVDAGPLAQWLQTETTDVAYSYGYFQYREPGNEHARTGNSM